MGFIEESAEWKTFSLEKNRYNAQALLSVVASELLTEDKWKNQSVVRPNSRAKIFFGQRVN